jgi:hypothetical protein
MEKKPSEKKASEKLHGLIKRGQMLNSPNFYREKEVGAIRVFGVCFFLYREFLC